MDYTNGLMLCFSIFDGDGARFANHIDNTTCDGRMLTVVTYLNPDWNPELGGQLRVQLAQKYRDTCTIELTKSEESEGPVTEFVDVFPECGRVVMFYSSEVRHEVMPTFGHRHACTIWYYDTAEREAAVKNAGESGKGTAAAIASMEAQTEARTFIADLMGRDEENEGELMDATIITPELLTELNEKVIGLSEEALDIVASITGAPSAESFREGFKLLVPDDLKSIRKLFRRMGLNNE